MIYKRWQIAAIVFGVLLGLLAALPNLAGPGVLRYLPFGQQIYLGLDLKGGTYLQLQVDIPAAEKERAQTTLENIRSTLRTARIPYDDLRVTGSSVSIHIRDANRVADAKRVLQPIVGTGASPDYTIADNGSGTQVLTPNQAALQARTDDILTRSVEIIRRRVDETGVSEPTIERQGSDRIIVELPGVQDPDRLKRLLGTTAKMTFRLVDTTANPADAAPGRIPPEDELLHETEKNGTQTPYLVQRRVAVDGDRLTQASSGFDPRGGEPVVNFGFDSRGAREFGDITKANVGKPFAIVLDNRVISAPVIREPILGGSGQISGNFTVESANELAILLRGGALPAPLKVIEERTVGPNLGADAIRVGIYACAIGGTLVIFFMLYFYRLFGVFASIGMITNLALLMGALSLLQASLTLPGIVGILLTVGMSVDANVLINERIREEARKGKTALAAVQTGFSRAMSTIIDANMTTLLKMVILYGLGSGPVRGFAITISLGIMTSMFTSIVLVRLLIATWYRRTRPRVLNPAQRNLFGPRLVRDDTKIAFMKGRYAGLITSAVLSIGSLVLCYYPGLNLGIDFRGGIAIQAHMPEAANFQALRAQLSKLNLGPVELQQFGTPQDVAIRIERQPGGDTADQNAATAVRTTLQTAFPGTMIESVDAVGATVSSELFSAGLTALGVALMAMLIYIWIRFEWQFGVAATATLLLDITKICGLYALTQFQFNTTSIVAILTIMGYSINDKVVVYDRVRENLRLFRRMTLRELIDRSINETLSRTIATSGTVFLAILPLALMSSGDIRQFAFTLLIGIVIGTSSSIFIAAPILLLLGEGRIRPHAAPAEGAPATVRGTTYHPAGR
jgi:SecD/SecF fusion protein